MDYKIGDEVVVIKGRNEGEIGYVTHIYNNKILDITFFNGHLSDMIVSDINSIELYITWNRNRILEELLG